MRWAMAIVGALLLAFGLAVWLEGLDYTRSREVLDVGPIEAEVKEERPIPKVVGVVAAIGGVGLIAAGLAGRRA